MFIEERGGLGNFFEAVSELGILGIGDYREKGDQLFGRRDLRQLLGMGEEFIPTMQEGIDSLIAEYGPEQAVPFISDMLRAVPEAEQRTELVAYTINRFEETDQDAILRRHFAEYDTETLMGVVSQANPNMEPAEIITEVNEIASFAGKMQTDEATVSQPALIELDAQPPVSVAPAPPSVTDETAASEPVTVVTERNEAEHFIQSDAEYFESKTETDKVEVHDSEIMTEMELEDQQISAIDQYPDTSEEQRGLLGRAWDATGGHLVDRGAEMWDNWFGRSVDAMEAGPPLDPLAATSVLDQSDQRAVSVVLEDGAVRVDARGATDPEAIGQMTAEATANMIDERIAAQWVEGVRSSETGVAE